MLATILHFLNCWINKNLPKLVWSKSIFVQLIANELFPLYARKEYQNINARLLPLTGEYRDANIFLIAYAHALCAQ